MTMGLAFTSATSGKQYPDIRDVPHTDAIHKDFNGTTEEHKSYPSNTSSTDGPDKEDRKLTLLDLAKWAQERQWKWRGSPDVGTNHDAYFLEAAEEDLVSDNEDNEADKSLDAKR